VWTNPFARQVLLLSLISADYFLKELKAEDRCDYLLEFAPPEITSIAYMHLVIDFAHELADVSESMTCADASQKLASIVPKQKSGLASRRAQAHERETAKAPLLSGLTRGASLYDSPLSARLHRYSQANRRAVQIAEMALDRHRKAKARAARSQRDDAPAHSEANGVPRPTLASLHHNQIANLAMGWQSQSAWLERALSCTTRASRLIIDPQHLERNPEVASHCRNEFTRALTELPAENATPNQVKRYVEDVEALVGIDTPECTALETDASRWSASPAPPRPVPAT